MTQDLADELLHIKKKIFIDNEIKDSIVLNQTSHFNMRFELVSKDNEEYSFLWEFKQSSKDALRISLHFQENDSKIGLFRVDYNAGHPNPVEILPSLPDKFKPYAGQWLRDSHVHYYVEGYKPLAWALPIEETDVSIKDIKDNDISSSFADAIMNFAKMINIETTITINKTLL